ncbi:hypothetical protein BG011_008899 [Mortierella polycephala]|uniref:Uncharacterized protein n=1 Tax=Mortierella polycephala TaxID=41804 RepID=A0A9P6QB39_9FUNG|nr:hypothetical protein BG011_008899 [Mortierella polycephala]
MDRRQPSNQGQRINGYRRGHVPLPQVPVKITLQPSVDPRVNDRARIQGAIDWVGRLPLQTLVLRDGVTVIQTRGAVLLQAGIYRVQGSLILNRSGVVLRGEGNGPTGTILMAVGQFKHDFIYLHGLLDPSFQGTPEYLAKYGGSKVMSPKDPYIIQDEDVAQVADKYIPVGTTRLPVKDISNFKVGAEVIVQRKAKAKWIKLLGMDHIPPRPNDPSRTMNWDPRQYELRYVRKIMAIEKSTKATSQSAPAAEPKVSGRVQSRTTKRSTVQARGPQSMVRIVADTNRTGRTPVLDSFKLARVRDDDDDKEYEGEDEDDQVREDAQPRVPGYLILDIPTVMNMDPVYGSGIVYNFKREIPIPSDVGVENLALWSEHDAENPEDERHGWFSVMVDHCENCWAVDIKVRNFVSGIKAGPGSKHVTIQDCEITDPISIRSAGGRRYSFMLQGQMGLVKRCFSSDARHDFLTGSKTSGPNVFVDSEGVRANNDAGPHDRWSTGTLYDNVHSHDLNVRNRGWMGSGQGWSGAFQVVYRCSAEVPVMFQSPPGATNWVIEFDGALGEKSVEFQGDDATFLDTEPQEEDRIPRSLYWAQLVARKGGSSSMGKVIENYVGVAGRNRYPQPLPRAFTM